jgi:outer membrane protein assembly factor BamB
LYGSAAYPIGLITINTQTGAGSYVGPFGTQYAVWGLEWDSKSNTLYGVTNDAVNVWTDSKLLKIDRTTGTATPVGGLVGSRVDGLAYDSINDKLYGSDDPGNNLVVINTSTGIGTVIGSMGYPGLEGLAFNPLDGKLYSVDVGSGALVRIEPSTGIGTTVAQISPSWEQIRGLSFDPSGAVLYGAYYPSNGTSTHLVTINISTGQITYIGPTGYVSLEGLAFAAESAPAQLVDWWPMFHHALNHTGYSTSTRAPNTNQTLWNYLTGGWVASSPAVVNGIVYVGSGDWNVSALNASTGALIWKTPTNAPVYSSPAVADGKVYVGSGDVYPYVRNGIKQIWWIGGIYCFNASTGRVIWKNDTLGYPVESSPAVDNGMVFIGACNTASSGNVYAYSASTGALIWTFRTYGWVRSSPAVAGGVVFVGSNDTNVYALNEFNGNLIQTYRTGGWVVSSPAVADGRVFVGSCNYSVYAFNAATGEQVWSKPTGYMVESSPAVAGGVVFVGSDDWKVYAFNASTGAYIWQPYKTVGMVTSSPAVADGKVYVGSWNAYGDENNTPPAPFYCLNASTGAYIWSYQTNSSAFDGSPAIVGGVVYVGACDVDDHVYAFESSTTVQAYCNTQGAYVNVAITLDGSPTGFTTPHTFTSLSMNSLGTHTITVPSTDLSGHPFKNWNTGQTTPTITVSIAGFTYIAYYQAVIAGKTQLTTDPSTQDMPSLLVVNNGVFQGYFLAYQSWETGTANNGDIFVEKYDKGWNLLTRVQATSLPSYQDSPSLALIFDGTGYLLELAYVSTETTDGYYHIFAQKFGLNLNFITKKQITSSSSDQDLPSIIFDGSQSIYVAYQSWETGNSYQGDIFFEKLNLNLNPLSRVRVTTESSYQDCPSLLYNPTTGTIYVAYVSNETGNLNIFKKHYDSNLNDLDVKAQLTTDPTTQYRPSLAPIYGSTVSNILGLQMAYHSWETGPSNQRDIFVENFELVCPSWGKTQITNDQFYSATPSIVPSLVALGSSWCPGYVAYVSNEAGNWDIWLQQLASTPPPTYSATIVAHCNTEGVDVAVAITKDSSPSGFSTPHTFTGLTGSHTFTVPGTDGSGHAFKQWSTGSTSLTITVSSGGTYTAYYGDVQGPIVYVSPYSSVAVVGRNVTIAVNVANVTNLYSWQIKLYFNSSSVNCTSASYPDYHVFAGKPFTQVTPVIGQNYIIFGASLQSSGRFDGSGTLCLINFTGLKEGACPLQFDATETFLLDPNLNSIPTTKSPGLITVVPTSPLIGDITGPNGVPDGTVNMYDISLVSKYFLQTIPPAPSICDITGQTPNVPDGKIDMKDISLVCKHFMEHYP